MATTPIRDADGDRTPILTAPVETLDGDATAANAVVQLIGLVIGDTDAVQVSADNPVPVSIATAPLPSGAATESKLEAVRALLAGTVKIDDAQLGTWGYRAGVSGTPATSGLRVISISATGGDAGGTITINGGNSIPLAAGQPFSVPLRGLLIAPTIVFTGTASYFVETLA